MKKSTLGVVLLVIGIVIGGVGVLQKILHAPNANTIRTIGTTVSAIGLVIYCYALFYKKKN